MHTIKLSNFLSLSLQAILNVSRIDAANQKANNLMKRWSSRCACPFHSLSSCVLFFVPKWCDCDSLLSLYHFSHSAFIMKACCNITVCNVLQFILLLLHPVLLWHDIACLKCLNGWNILLCSEHHLCHIAFNCAFFFYHSSWPLRSLSKRAGNTKH